jgi:DNA-binding transcriptional LysR family regulator
MWNWFRSRHRATRCRSVLRTRPEPRETIRSWWLTDPSSLTEGQDFGVVGTKSWRLADLGAKHALLLAGVGWGNMPEPMVRDDFTAGRLKRLDLPDSPSGLYRLEAIYRTDTPPGPAASWLIQRF